ncbi:hypothetical protein BON22_3006 [Cyberlindnera fabianii]|nr:hypothetical protein BON22_3006 [Cyberlindnera fabianii]
MYTVSYLYYTYDVWRFTVFWSLIFFIGFYAAVGIWASFIHRKFSKGLMMVVFYVILGGVQALISGTVLGLVIAAIYKAGLFSMSTWIPMCCGMIQILLNLVTSYPMMSVVM